MAMTRSPELLAAALLTLAAAVPGRAAAGVPPDVAGWFEQEAATTIVATLDGLEVDDDDDPPPSYLTVEVGEPRQVYRWSADVLAGRPSTEPVQPVDEWVAPFHGDGEPAGTVTAWREDGAAALAQLDDDAHLARALAELPAATTYVALPELGAHFALQDDDKVVALTPVAVTVPGDPVPLEQLRRELPGWLADHQGAVVEPGTPSRWWLAPTLGGAVAVAAVVAGGLLRRAWRRAPVTGPETQLSPDRTGRGSAGRPGGAKRR